MEQQIAQLVPDRVASPSPSAWSSSSTSSTRYGRSDLAGLGPVPGAAVPEVAHHRQRASKR